MGVETYFDGKTKWSYMVDAEEVNISTPDPEDENTFDPSTIFTEYKDGYKVRFIREVFQNNRALYEIDLLPKDVKGSEFNRIKLFIDKDKNVIYKVIRYGKDGNDYIITLNKVVEQTVSTTMFVYDASKHPDVEVIDLRD
jgi:outer membrane lipoprotein-sorting protein